MSAPLYDGKCSGLCAEISSMEMGRTRAFNGQKRWIGNSAWCDLSAAANPPARSLALPWGAAMSASYSSNSHRGGRTAGLIALRLQPRGRPTRVVTGLKQH